MIVNDPHGYFLTLVAGKNANQFKTILRQIEQSLYDVGFGQQCNTGGEIRGRLFLPTAASGSCAPRNAAERKLGVKQEEVCFEHAVDVLDGDEASGYTWAWKDRGGPAYVPIGGAPTPQPEPQPQPEPTPPTDLVEVNRKLDALKAQIDALEFVAEAMGVKAAVKQVHH